MKGQPSSHVYPQRALAPGEVRITGDNIAISPSVSEDGEATEACCADTLLLQPPEGQCDITRATTHPASHLLLGWGGRSCLKSFIMSFQDLWLFCAFYYCLLDQLLVAESKQGGWKAHHTVKIFWRALWRAGVWRFSVKSMRRAGWILFGFSSNVLFHSPRNVSLRDAHLKEDVKKSTFEGQDSLSLKGVKISSFLSQSLGVSLFCKSSILQNMSLWSFSKDGLFTPLQNENKSESLWTRIAGLQIAVHDEYFPYKRTDKYSRIVQ